MGNVVEKKLGGGRFAGWNVAWEIGWGDGWCSRDVDVWEGMRE